MVDHDEVMMSVEDRLSLIETQLATVIEILTKADNTITKVAAEVMPTVNQLMASPLLKMLGGKK